MCGVAFLLAPHLAEQDRAARMRRAVGKLRHRGPDEQGVLARGAALFGHTRLSIVDLAGGHQPVCDGSGRWTLAFNGEIYNYRELRRSLEGRWAFRDASDTEVLLAGLVLHGKAFINRLDGMWAFVLHDGLDDSLLLARDPFGKKPLYYRSAPAMLACASEIGALRALCSEDSWAEDAAGIGDYFRYGFTMPGTTCWREVREVPPGSWMSRDAEGVLRTERYWKPDATPWEGNFEDAAEEAERLLRAAVLKRQMAADVEVGAFLSGGVDSTIVCALARQAGTERLRTFTAGFGEPTYDEREHAARAAAELGTRHYEEVLTPEEALRLAVELPSRFGQPFGDASLVPTTMVSAVAAKYVKVVLTGDGGDEVFGGYARYSGRRLMQMYRRMPAPLRRLFEATVLAFPEPVAHHSGSLLKRAQLFVGMARDGADRYVAPAAMRSDALARLVGQLPAGNPVPESPWPVDSDELRQMLIQDWLVWLPQDILAKTDRASMSNSLEARSPFLDRDLVEFAVRLPWRWHFDGLKGKRMLRAAMRGQVPDFVWSRRKQGFASPVGHWMRSRLGDELQAMAHGSDLGIVDGHGLRGMLAEHKNGSRDHSQPLWLAYCYLRWRGERI